MHGGLEIRELDQGDAANASAIHVDQPKPCRLLYPAKIGSKVSSGSSAPARVHLFLEVLFESPLVLALASGTLGYQVGWLIDWPMRIESEGLR